MSHRDVASSAPAPSTARRALARPGTPLGDLLGELSLASADAEPAGAGAGPHGAEAGPHGAGRQPFLTVVVRTAGTHPATFGDLLLGLAAQTCDSFDVVVSASGEAAAATSAAVAAFDAPFRDRVRVLDLSAVDPAQDAPAHGALAADGPAKGDLPESPAGDHAAGKRATGEQATGEQATGEQAVWVRQAAAANHGIAAASGRYVAVLDDDQVPFGHWVELLRDAAERRPAAVVRLAVATQQVVATPGRWQRAGTVSQPAGTAGLGVDAFDVAGRPAVRRPADADLVDLLAAAPEPICGFAVPRHVFTALGVRFDPTLGPGADWLAVLRAVQWCGLQPLDGVGLLRRVWWDDARAATGDSRSRVLAALDTRPLLLDRRSASRVAALHAAAGPPGEPMPPVVPADEHVAQVRALQAACADARAQLAEVHASTSWRVTAPLRAAVDWWRRR